MSFVHTHHLFLVMRSIYRAYLMHVVLQKRACTDDHSGEALPMVGVLMSKATTVHGHLIYARKC